MSGWTPAVVALDVDGTLLTYEEFHTVPRPSVVAAVRTVRDAGADVVLATGRSLHATLPIVEALGITSGYAVCSNGAVVMDVATGEAVEVTTFDAEDPIRYFAAEIPDAVLAVEELGVGFRVSGDFPAGELAGKITVVGHDELIRDKVTRLVVRWPNGDRDRLRAVARASGLPSVDYAIGYSAWLDIMPEGVSKATGLASVVKRGGHTAADVLAVGDGHNDVEMLQWAGHGVAMGQAPDDVKAIADEVTGDVEVEGLVTLLHRYFPPPRS